MSGKLLSPSVFIALASLLVVHLSLAIYLPQDQDDTFCLGKADGDYEYPAPNCSLFYSCSHEYTWIRECAPVELYYNKDINACDWPWSFPAEKQYDCMGIPVEDRTTRTPISSTEGSPVEPTNPPAGPSDDPFCEDKEDGTYDYPEDCGKFYHCSHQVTYIKDCPAGLWFNETGNACEYPGSFPEEKQEACEGLARGAYLYKLKEKEYV